MRTLLSLFLLLPVLLLAQTITPIANIQDSTSVYDGIEVTVEGVVTIGAGITNDQRLNAFIQDSSGKGMMLFDHDITAAHEADLLRGNRLQVTGTVDEYNDITELTGISYTVLETGVDIAPYIIPLTLAQADDYAEWEGTLAQVAGTLYEDPYSVGGGANLNIEDTAGDRLTVRVWDSTGITLTGLSQGANLTAVGVVNIYGSDTQVLPGYQEDIVVEVVEEPVISDISYSPAAPTEDDPINVLARITDADGTIEEAFLEYRLASETGFTTLDMDDSGDDYTATIPAMSTFTSEPDDFVFRITAMDDDDNTTTCAEQTIGIGGGGQFIPIATIQDNIDQYDGHEVEIEGVVTIGAGVLRDDQLNAYIQDGSGRGLQLYASSITSAYEADLVRGNRLQVTGTVDEYNGTTEVTDFTYTVVETGVDLAEVTVAGVIAGVQDYAYWEGTYVKLPGLVLDSFYAGGGHNITLVDGDGTEITARIWDTTDIDYSQVADGDNMLVGGVIGSYNNASQIMPGYQEDLLNLDKPITQIIWDPVPAFASDALTVSTRIEYTTSITTATLAWSLASTGIYTDVPMSDESAYWYAATLPSMASLTSEDDNFLVRISAQTAAGQTIQSNVFTIPVYTGAPIFDEIEIDSDAMDAYSYVHYPFLDEPVDIVATILDYDGAISEATVRFSRAGTATLDSTAVMTSVGNNHWTAELPPLANLTTLDDNYIVQLEATDDEGSVSRTEVILVEVAPRCPIITGITFTDSPEPGEDLPMQLHIYDTDGLIVDGSAVLQYSLDYTESIYTMPLTVDAADSTLFTGVILGRSGGTTVHVNAEAEDYAGNAASEYPDWSEGTLEYTWPVRTHTAILKVPAQPFDPYHGETFPIDYFARQGDKIVLRIYSAEGKLVHTPANAIVAAEDGINRYEWDGRNRARRLLPLGIYICHLEVVSADGGDKKTDRAPIVIGAPLH
ncbi:MAG: hypothetical protein K8R90_08060 [Candidatus Cloacimonetes bacterium]|nr:hypothetical protein [Candidatus Cloacimonadota bacterium]